MRGYTKLTDLEVTGRLKAGGVTIGIDPDDYEVTEDDAQAAAGSAPTKAEFDAVVALCNELKEKHNAMVAALTETE